MEAIDTLNLLSWFYLATAVLSLCIGLYVFLLDREKSINKIFFWFALNGFYWGLTGFGLRQANSYDDAYLWMKIGAFWPITVASIIHFCVVYAGFDKKFSKKFLYFLLYSPAVFFSFFELTTNQITTVQSTAWGWTSGLPSINVLYVSSTVWALVISVFAIGISLLYYLQTQKKQVKKRTGIIIVALSLPIILSALSETFFPLVGFNFPKLTVPGYILCLGLIGFAMWKYQLFSLTPSFAADNIISIMPDMLFITSLDGRIETVNNTTLHELGYSNKAQIQKMNISSLYSPPTEKDAAESTKADVTGEIFVNKNVMFHTAQNFSFPALLSKSVLYGENHNPQGFVFVASNISELKKVEDELRDLNKNLDKKVKERTVKIYELLEEKNDFIHLLGHDLKNPLGPLLNLLPVVNKKVNDDQTRQVVSLCLRNAEKMKSIIDDTLKVVRANEDGFKSFEEVNLQDLVNSVLSDNELLLKKNDFSVKNLVDEDLVLNVNKFQIEEVFSNLISNAVKYTPESKIGVISISAETEGNKVIFSVSDNGSGLTNEQLNNIFDKFYHSGKPRKGMESTGLGLAICKRIVENHGGSIWAESNGSGEGSTFLFTLPLHHPAESRQNNDQIDSYDVVVDEIDMVLQKK